MHTNIPFTLERLDHSHRSGTPTNHSVNGTDLYRTVLEQNGKSCHFRTFRNGPTIQCERLPFQNRSNACALAIMLYNTRIIIVWRAWYAEVRYLRMANWSDEETLKLIELWSEDSLALRDLGGSLAPIGPRGALINTF